MTIKLNGLELEITDGAEVTVSEDGKKITIKAAQTVIENHYHYNFQPAAINPPYYQPYVQPTWPQNPIYPVICGGEVNVPSHTLPQVDWGGTSSVSSQDSPIGDVICRMSTHHLVMSEREMDQMIANGRMSYTLSGDNRVKY
jgi:hypothetical protein